MAELVVALPWIFIDLHIFTLIHATQCHGRTDTVATCLGSTPCNRTAHLQLSRHAVQSSRNKGRLTYHKTISDNSTTLYEPKTKWMCFTAIVIATILQYPIYRVSQEECARLLESVPYVKVYPYNPKHLNSKMNCYGVNGQRSLKVWQLLHNYWLPNRY